MAGWFGINREISREQHGSGPTASRPADQPRAPEKPREAGAHLYAVVDNARGMAAAVRDTSGPTEGADSTGNRPEVEPAAPAQRKPHLNLLGIAALGLWILAVALGIGAPLLGIAVDFRLVVAVLIASGVVSLLSLPVTALSSNGKDNGKP